MELVKVSKNYVIDGRTINILRDASVSFEKNKLYAIIGHSGVGKSTLLNILGLLDDYDSGNYYFDGIDVKELSESEKAELRLYKIGFVFQSFYLNPNFTALENVMIPMLINKRISNNDIKVNAIKLLKKFNLFDRINHYPKQLSGGEQQRVSLARALANDPDIILADEPTGNLDKENEKIILDELKKIARSGKIVIVVTHNDIIKKYADILLTIEEGKIKKCNLG